MSKGYFVDSDGRPMYYGRRADKARLEATHTWVETSLKPEDFKTDFWDGAAWRRRPKADAEEALRQAYRDLRESDRVVLPRVIEDVWAALKDKGIVTDSDLPQAARDKLAKREALRNIIRGP